MQLRVVFYWSHFELEGGSLWVTRCFGGSQAREGDPELRYTTLTPLPRSLCDGQGIGAYRSIPSQLSYRPNKLNIPIGRPAYHSGPRQPIVHLRFSPLPCPPPRCPWRWLWSSTTCAFPSASPPSACGRGSGFLHRGSRLTHFPQGRHTRVQPPSSPPP